MLFAAARSLGSVRPITGGCHVRVRGVGLSLRRLGPGRLQIQTLGNLTILFITSAPRPPHKAAKWSDSACA